MKKYTAESVSAMANENSDSEESADMSGEENVDLSGEEHVDLSGGEDESDDESPGLSGGEEESDEENQDESDDDDDEAPELVKPSKVKKRKLSTQGGEVPSSKKSKKATNGDTEETSEEEQEKPDEDLELNARTVYVGNIPVTTDSLKLKKLFSKFGIVETVRIRGIPAADPKISKKVAYITKQFNPEIKSFFAFIRFEDRDGAVKAAEANGMVFKEHHLKICLMDFQDKHDDSKAIFVGNLHFLTEDEDLWKAFEACGPITSVHIVRDALTRYTKGFGYVNFENADSVALALEMENVKIHDREVRINICKPSEANKKGTGKKTFHGLKHRQSWDGGSYGPMQGGPRNFGRGGPRSFGRGGPRNFARGGPSNFGRGGPRNFGRGGPRNFGRGGPRNFGRGGPRNFGGQFPRNPTESGSNKPVQASPRNGESGPQKTKKISPKIKSDNSNAKTPKNFEGAKSMAKKKTQPNKSLQQKKLKAKQIAPK